ncbi:MAG TPA: iron-containing redox enzyme family protein [Leptospiraceae bacterium]|nr:iron-containing redox enzyme family protein [Leptospiraceae bacterium]HRG76868.1 iron-containing redox enzyme family protein [Leptospiraceae bacterium]
MSLTKELKLEVENHPVLKTKWLVDRKKHLSKEDLCLWLSQEYFVSVDFVNWFLWTASLTNNIKAKILLVHNIWEELGEGEASKSHVMVLTKFLNEIGIPESDLKILSHTQKYLEDMKQLTNSNIYSALGALGPANEYLLKLEYGQMYESYQKLSEKEKLPKAFFFEVNLEADESHSAELFKLIEAICDTPQKIEHVKEGNRKALDARLQFYEGLELVGKL